MKKILCLILSFAFIFCLTGCQKKPQQNNVETQNKVENKSSFFAGQYDENETAYKNLQAIFEGQELVNEYGMPQYPDNHFVKIKDNDVSIRYATFKGLKPGEPVNVMQITDLHFNKLNERDIEENLPSVVSSYQNRPSFQDEGTLPGAKKSLALHKYFDAVVVTGDVIDYLTWGSLDMVKEHILDVIPNVMFSMGNHETTRVMQGTVSDDSSLESRLNIIKEYWPNDIDYSSQIINDRVMLIQMNNGNNNYSNIPLEKFENDINKAKQEQLVILIFQHIPIYNGIPEAKITSALRYGKDPTYFNRGIGANNSDDVTNKVYNLITTNADVIKGIFCGHLHTDYYTEILATYQNGSETINTTIPQHVLAINSSQNGNIMAITVE